MAKARACSNFDDRRLSRAVKPRTFLNANESKREITRGLMDNSGQAANDQDSIEQLCQKCGATFSAFLHEMADQNAKVVCPNCQQNPDCSPRKAGEKQEECEPEHSAIQKPN
jgi:protein-arginine kinase activator protein McsA